jgi:hypothetical protein
LLPTQKMKIIFIFSFIFIKNYNFFELTNYYQSIFT